MPSYTTPDAAQASACYSSTVPETKPSKSAQKRQHLELQQLGERLLEFSEDALDALELDEFLHDAVLAAQKMKSREALRRQRQRIGKLMRNVDPEPIRRAIAARDASSGMNKTVFRNAEKWRDRILAEGSTAIQALFGTDMDALQIATSLYQNVLAAGTSRRRRGFEREIFRHIHQFLALEMQEPAGGLQNKSM